MSQSLIAFAPASGPGVGGGHVIRCLALALALKAKGARCVFVAGPDGAAILQRFGAGFDCIVTPDDPARLARLNALGAEAAVLDNYALGAGFEGALSAPVVMAVDDLADRDHAVQLLLDAAYGRAAADYTARAPGAKLLLGPDYALLRPGFERQPRPVPDTLARLFISFGLSDVEGVTARVVRRLLALAPDAAIDVAVADGAQSLPALRGLAVADPRLIVHIDADTAPLMRGADAGVGAGGAMTWERRAAGLPSLAVIVAENQRPGIEALAREGVVLAVDLKSPTFDADFDAAFFRLADPAQRRAMIDNPHAACDGRGAERAADALLAAIASRG